MDGEGRACEAPRMSSKERPVVAILGCGTMGEAIVGGALASGALDRDHLIVTARRSERAEQLGERFRIPALTDNVAAARRCDVALLTTKPQVAKEVLSAPGMAEALDGKLLVSIAAGVRMGQLASWVPRTALIRAMPNTPSVIGEGMTVLSPGASTSPEQVALIQAIFESVGRVRTLDEKYLDAVTALSGSGPAFACVIVEALADGGVMMGLPRDVAIELAAQTVQGAARLVLESGTHPAALKDQVTTPAGCTIAGLLTMEDGRIRSTLARTIQEATRVAGTLGQDD